MPLGASGSLVFTLQTRVTATVQPLGGSPYHYLITWGDSPTKVLRGFTNHHYSSLTWGNHLPLIYTFPLLTRCLI